MSKKNTRTSIPRDLWKTLSELLRVPTGPFNELWLRDELIRRLGTLHYTACETDQFGNLRVRYNPRGKRPAFFLQAHLDHPGFLYLGGGQAEILGGLSNNLTGGKLRFFPSASSRGIPARIIGVHTKGQLRMAQVKIIRDVPLGTPGMFDFPPLVKKGNYLEGRAFDDPLGAALLAYVLEQASRKKLRQSFDVLFTRAEEVGFVGALSTIKRKSFNLPKTMLNIEMPGVSASLVAGDGVMIRAGDRIYNFDPELTSHLSHIAEELQASRPWFRAQRRLGLKGITEATAFSLHGFRAGGLCVPVERAHNTGSKGRPAPERVHINDLLSLVEILMCLVSQDWAMRRSYRLLREKVEQNWRNERRRLKV